MEYIHAKMQKEPKTKLFIIISKPGFGTEMELGEVKDLHITIYMQDLFLG